MVAVNTTASLTGDDQFSDAIGLVRLEHDLPLIPNHPRDYLGEVPNSDIPTTPDVQYLFARIVP